MIVYLEQSTLQLGQVIRLGHQTHIFSNHLNLTFSRYPIDCVCVCVLATHAHPSPQQVLELVLGRNVEKTSMWLIVDALYLDLEDLKQSKSDRILF